jgi:uncharacterized protein (TIGR00725 family)
VEAVLHRKSTALPYLSWQAISRCGIVGGLRWRQRCYGICLQRLFGGRVFLLGVLPGENSSQTNGFVSAAVPAGMGVSRNRIVALTGEVVCAVGGGYGTLSEIAFALQAGKHVCGLGKWENTPGVVSVYTPEEALEFVIDKIGVD